ncbi:MAG: alpha-L-fucosidase [Nitrososphaerota archaeon]|nr:alpha-L-fucosidase [Candidatus Bathyarchaeota archaeon]MDW8048690.1 alpha-L-fucosidase [Nitrososphaerota archaeon]
METFKLNWSSISWRVPEWFKDAKFGIYCHFGVYCVPAFDNEWYSHNMYVDGHKANRYHIEKFGHPSKFGYKDFIPLFKAEKFDADEWCNIFLESGAKFAGVVAEHADGFAMWDSDHTDWCAGKMGPERDIVSEVCNAVKKMGLKFITTFHHHWNWGWYPTDDETVDASNPIYSGLYGPRAPRCAFGINPSILPDNNFQTLWMKKIMEVIDKYAPDIIYFDSRLNIIDEKYREEVVEYYYDRIGRLGQHGVVTYKCQDLPAGVGVVTVERSRMNNLKEYVWMEDDSIDWKSWCYVQNPNFKDPGRIIAQLVDVVSKNGVLLLNITPKSDGEIPEEVKKILLEIGEWLRINGEAIYGSRPWRIYGEGPTQFSGDIVREETIGSYKPGDIRFTRKSNTLYAILLEWPGHNITINSLKKSDVKVHEVTLLGLDKKLRWTQNDEGLNVCMPRVKPCNYAYTLKILLDYL